MSNKIEGKKMKEKTINHPFLALIIMIIVVVIATNFIPAGQFSRFSDPATGRTIVDPTTFTYVDNNPAGITDFFKSFYYGFTRGSGVIALVLFVGGAFGVIKALGLMDIAVHSITNKFGSKGILYIAPVVMIFIFFFCTFTGFRELDVIFISLMIPVCISLGYDTMTALGIVLLSSCAGFAAALANPFFTGIAHTIAELPMYSAMWYRTIIALFYLITGFLYMLRYANKVKADPSKSILYGSKREDELRKHYSENDIAGKEVEFTTRLKIAGIAFLGLFFFMIYGTLKLGFGFADLCGVFFAIAIIPGFIGGFNANEICESFAEGCKDLLVAALIVLFARSILVVLEDAKVIDTLIHFLAQFVVGSSSVVSAVAVYLLQTIINIVIPSGSGQAVVTMPIVTPLADLGGVTRQVACLASQLGDGLTNYIYPTNGILMAVIAVANIPFSKWVKWFLPIFLFWSVSAMGFIAVAQMINLGPF